MAELPKCTICNFSPIVVSEKYVMHDDNKHCPLSSAEDMTPEQWTKLMGQGETEPVAILCREIGETTWFDHQPIRPGSIVHIGREASVHWDTCKMYTHPAPAVDDGVLRDAIINAHMAGQADAGVDPSYSNAQAYAMKEQQDAKE